MNINNQTPGQGILLVDYINEIIDPKGKLAGKGYATFAETHNTLDNVAALLRFSRTNGIPVFHVRIGFSPDYKEQPERSPLFGAAKKFGALQLGTWATEFHPKVAPMDGEAILSKHRVSAFYSTPLELLLRKHGVRDLLICGVATDLAVQSAARDAHDRDFGVAIVTDCCAAASDDDHAQSLKTLAKIARLVSLEQLLQS